MEALTLRRPDDWHVHLRDGAMLEAVLPFTARAFARAIVMPNLTPPVASVAAAEGYRQRIRAALPKGADFTPLMTCYLTDQSNPDEIERGFRHGVFTAVKLYPAHATTNSAAGVTDIAKTWATLERMEKIGMPLLIHGEVTDPEVDIFDREAVFIERVLAPLMHDASGLEDRARAHHDEETPPISSPPRDPILRQRSPRITSSSIAMRFFSGGLRPHVYCLPIAKREDASPGAAARRHFGRRPSSSSAPTARRTRSTIRSAIAAVPEFSRRPPRSKSMPRCLTRRTPWRVSKPSLA